MSATSRRESPKRRPWPPIEPGRGVEAVRWQVWIGVQLREWRRRAPFGTRRGFTQTLAAQRLGLRQEALSRVENGFRRVDAVELLACARAYHRSPADLAGLFAPPTPERWAIICLGRVRTADFRQPPIGVLPASSAT